MQNFKYQRIKNQKNPQITKIQHKLNSKTSIKHTHVENIQKKLYN